MVNCWNLRRSSVARKTILSVANSQIQLRSGGVRHQSITCKAIMTPAAIRAELCALGLGHLSQLPVNKQLRGLIRFLFLFGFFRRPIHLRPSEDTLLNPLPIFNGFQPKEKTSWAENCPPKGTLRLVESFAPFGPIYK